MLEDAKGKLNDRTAKSTHGGDVRAAILNLIGMDEDVVQSIVDSVSQVIVSKLHNDESFIAKLADGLINDGVLGSIKQNVYDIGALDAKKKLTTVESLECRVGDLGKDNKAMRDKIDSMEQYSRRNNCLVVYDVPEVNKYTSEAVRPYAMAC